MKIFKLTVEQAKKALEDKKEFEESAQTQIDNKHHFFRRLILAIILFWLFGVGDYAIAIGTRGIVNDKVRYVSQDVGKIVYQVSTSITYLIYLVLGIFALTLILYLFSFLFTKVQWLVLNYAVLVAWMLTCVVCILPFSVGLLLGGWGKIAGSIMIVYMLYFIFCCFKTNFDNFLDKASVIDYEPKTARFLMLTLLLVGSSLILGFIHTNQLGLGIWNFVGGLLFPVVYGIFSLLLFIFIDYGLKLYYIYKYPELRKMYDF